MDESILMYWVGEVSTQMLTLAGHAQTLIYESWYFIHILLFKKGAHPPPPKSRVDGITEI